MLKVTYYEPQRIWTYIVVSALIVMGTVAYGSANGSTSPFVGLNGAWAGPGTVTLASGAKEAIRCRANYNVDGGGANLKLELRCSSDSYKFELQSNVTHRNGEVSGHWAELTNRIGGTIAGKATGERIEVRVDGTLSAMLAVNTRADKQMVSIQSPGGPMSAVAISLSRSVKSAAQ